MEFRLSTFIIIAGSIGFVYFTKSALSLIRKLEFELSTEDIPRSIIHGMELSPWNLYIAIIRIRPEWESSDYPRLKNLVYLYRIQVVGGLLCLGVAVGTFILVRT